MAIPPIEYADASPAVRAVFDDIKATRNTENNSMNRALGFSRIPRSFKGIRANP